MFTLKQPTEQTSLGIKGYALVVPLLIVAGQILGVMAYGMLRNTFPFAGVSLPLVTAAMIVFTIAEEMTFRGLIQRCATSVMHPVLALLLTAGLYTAMTITVHNIAATLFAAVASLVLSFAYYAKPNLILTIAANTTFKLLFLGLILTFR
jgi:membrane protease YdiL (CAAX protease family)